MGSLRSVSRPGTYYLLIVALLFQGVSGIGGGIVLLADPSGALIGLPGGLLAGSPVRDYTIPGLILLAVLGVVPVVVGLGLWVRRTWAWYGAVSLGMAILGLSFLKQNRKHLGVA